MATLTFEAGGRTLFGTDAAIAAVVLEGLGADAVGANCSTGPAGMEEVIKAMAAVTDLPLIAKPNAGLPALNERGETVYEMGAEAFAEEMESLQKAGASIFGGCCGTTPDHIRSLRERMEGKARVLRERTHERYLSSERSLLAFGLDDPFLIIGERINPTGKKKLQEQLRQRDFRMVAQFAEEQETCGAAVLDVNLGMNGIDEKQSMLRALEEIGERDESSAVHRFQPCGCDGSGPAPVSGQGADQFHFPGDGKIGSAAGAGEEIRRHVHPAAFVGSGASGNCRGEDRHHRRTGAPGKAGGLNERDIVVDGLVTTVGANSKAALEALETIRYCRRKGLATVCGLSNISFGLPERSCINTAFLTMAIRPG